MARPKGQKRNIIFQKLAKFHYLCKLEMCNFYSYPLVIQYGLLENVQFIDDLPIEKPMCNGFRAMFDDTREGEKNGSQKGVVAKVDEPYPLLMSK